MPNIRIQDRGMDFPVFKGIICNWLHCNVDSWLKQWSQTLTNPIRLLFMGKKYNRGWMHLSKHFFFCQERVKQYGERKMNTYLKPFKFDFLLGKVQAVPLLFLPLNCKLPLWCSGFGQMDFQQSLPVLLLCSSAACRSNVAWCGWSLKNFCKINHW